MRYFGAYTAAAERSPSMPGSAFLHASAHWPSTKSLHGHLSMKIIEEDNITALATRVMTYEGACPFNAACAGQKGYSVRIPAGCAFFGSIIDRDFCKNIAHGRFILGAAFMQTFSASMTWLIL